MKNLFKYSIFILLILSILACVSLGVFYPEFFYQLAKVISDYIWPAIITLLTFLGLVVSGVIRKPPRSFNHFLENDLVQIATIILFLFISFLIVYNLNESRKSGIIVKLVPYNAGKQLNADLIYQTDSSEITRHIKIPNRLESLKPGKYTLQINEKNYFQYSEEIFLKPGQHDTVKITLESISGSIILYTQPSDVEIWLDNSFYGKSVDTIRNLLFKKYILEVKKEGYCSFSSTADLENNQVINFGNIVLKKLYLVTFECISSNMEFTVNGNTYKGSKVKVTLPEGVFNVTPKFGSRIYNDKQINVDKNNKIFYLP